MQKKEATILIKIEAIDKGVKNMKNVEKEIQPSSSNQMVVGKVSFNPYNNKPLDVWLKEQAVKLQNQ